MLYPYKIDAKTGKSVFVVLSGKHPPAREPSAEAMPEYALCPDPVPLLPTQEAVATVVRKMSGSAGLLGPDSEHLKDMCMRHGVASERLRDSIAALTGWVANEHVPWAAIRALRACRLAALDKQPGVRPVGIGETISRLMSKVVLYLCGFQATDSASNFNLCAGLPAGIEGAVHAMRVQTQRGNPEQGCQPQSETPGDKGVAGSGDDQSEEPLLQHHESEGAQSVEDEPLLDEPITQPEGDDLADLTPMVGQVSLRDCKDDDPDVACLVDARNGFNELNRKAMLWHVRHRWPMGARYAFNCYRYAAQLVVRRPQTAGYVVLSREGVTQGCPLAMLLYGLALSSLAEELRAAVPGVVQPWYADDAAMAGRASEVSSLMEALTRLGPK